MGFDREVTNYICGCYYEYWSHDFFNYKKDHQFVNICGKHLNKAAAKTDHSQREKQSVITYSKMQNQVQKKNTSSEKDRTQQMVEHIPSMNDDITTSYDGRCFIHLLGDVYVVAKEFKNKMIIHIRHYDETGERKIPTKKGVALNLSRWLLLEEKKDEIDNMFMKTQSAEEEQAYTVHLGGVVYVTVDPKFPTVDIRHFWQPSNVDKPIPTRKGVALNKQKWKRLCDTIQIMREFVPELKTTCVCYYSHPNELEALSCKECYPFEKEEENEWKEQESEFDIAPYLLTQT